MSNNMADIILHIDENTTHDKRELFVDSLLNLDGVKDANITDKNPHLMLVRYNPIEINSTSLLVAASQNGLHAELIGL